MARDFLSHMDDWKLTDDSQDIRGRIVRTPEGRELGTVQDLVADTDTQLVDVAILDTGAEYPVRDLEIRADDVVLHSGHADYPAHSGATRSAPADWRTERRTASTHPTGRLP
jgi:sporulation protein YlmC with PRC-barrel domain